MKISFSIIFFCILFFFNNNTVSQAENPEATMQLVNETFYRFVDMKMPFYGFASGYNNIDVYVVKHKKARKLKNIEISIINEHDLLLIGHRYAISIPKLLEEGNKSTQQKNSLSDILRTIKIDDVQIIEKRHINKIIFNFSLLKYDYLIFPLSLLSELINSFIIWLQFQTQLSWGMTIILFSILFKIFMTPNQFFINKTQDRVSTIQTLLSPELDNINSKYSGEEKHIKTLKIYKKYNVPIFYKVRPLLFVIVPIPFWIAIFNVLGAMPELHGEEFLWIKDLSLPDNIYQLPFPIPFLGSNINFLPIIMTIVAFFGVFKIGFYRKSIPTIYKQKRNLACMAFIFFILFYSFPSAMVLYWTCSNLLSLVKIPIKKY